MRYYTRLCLIFLALTGLARADTSAPGLVSVQSQARGDLARPIHVRVKVTNPGPRPLESATVVVVLQPEVPKPLQDQDPPVPDASSPTTLEQQVGPLKPGESTTVDIRTAYMAASNFVNSGSVSGGKGRGSFVAAGVLPNDPRGSGATVRFTVTIR